MPTLEEIYGVPVRTPLKRDFTAINQLAALNRQESLQTKENMAKLDQVFGEMYAKLNPADYAYVDQKKEDVYNRINNAVSFGNYAYALDESMAAARELASDKEFYARAKENQNYEKFKAQVENAYANKQISKLRMQRTLSENQYNFNGVYDENGNFLNYTPTEYSNPVRNMDLSDMVNKAGTMVHEKVQQYLLTNGDSNNIISTETITRKTKEAITETFNEIYANNPDAILALQADYDDLVYQLGLWEEEQTKYDKNSAEFKDLQNKIDQAFEQITDDGIIPDNKYENYLFKRTGNTIKNMSYETSKTTLRTLGRQGSGIKNPGGDVPSEYFSHVDGTQVVLENEPLTYTDFGVNLVQFNLLGDKLEKALSDTTNVPAYARPK